MPEVPSEELQTEPMPAESPVEQTADLKLVHSGVATKIPEDQIQPVELSAEELPSTVGGHEAEQPRQVRVNRDLIWWPVGSMVETVLKNKAQ
jgi:hypothetical protein